MTQKSNSTFLFPTIEELEEMATELSQIPEIRDAISSKFLKNMDEEAQKEFMEMLDEQTKELQEMLKKSQ